MCEKLACINCGSEKDVSPITFDCKKCYDIGCDSGQWSLSNTYPRQGRRTQMFLVYDEPLRRMLCKRENTVFKNYIGQDGAVERILDLLYQGYSHSEHLVAENVMLAGPPSTGKTTLVKLLCESLMIPVVLTDANQVNSGISLGDKKISSGSDTILHLILDLFARTDQPLQGVMAGSFAVYTAPVMAIFVDEIHGLKRKTADALLKATERNDGMLFGKDCVVDCRNVLFIGATTSWGKLHSAFTTRFLRVDLISPTEDEVTKIVKINNPDFSDELCDEVVFYGSLVPREALAFARSIRRHAERSGDRLTNCVWACAQREGIDQWGMRRQRVQILQALKNSPNGLNLRNICAAISCESEEVVTHWLPPLLFSKPPMVAYDGSVYSLTDFGESELIKRGA